MDLGNATINLGYGMSQMPYRPNIKINKLHDDAHLPTYGSANAACADLYAYIGLRMAPPEGWYIQGFARSGLSTKHGLAPVNAVPIIDQDYRGEIIIPLHNYSNIPQMITHGDRIAQMAVVPFWQADFEEVSELDETERGIGGFGSTGKQ